MSINIVNAPVDGALMAGSWSWQVLVDLPVAGNVPGGFAHFYTTAST